MVSRSSACIHTRRTRDEGESRSPYRRFASGHILHFMHASGSHFFYYQTSKHLVRVRSRAEARGATYGSEKSGYMLPQEEDTALSCETTSELPGNLH